MGASAARPTIDQKTADTQNSTAAPKSSDGGLLRKGGTPRTSKKSSRSTRVNAKTPQSGRATLQSLRVIRDNMSRSVRAATPKPSTTEASVMSILAPCLIETNPKPPKNKQKPRRETNLDTRAEKPKKRAAPSKVPKKSTGQMIVQKTQDEADVCCGCDCEEHDPSLLETACEEKAQITAAVNKPAPNIDNFFEMADPFANDDDMLDISDTIFDVANEFPDVLFQEGDIGTRRREGLNDKNEIEPRTAMLDVRPNQQSAKA